MLCFLLLLNLFLQMFRIQLVLDCQGKRLDEFHYSDTEIKKILNLLHLCVKQKAFIFNDVFYYQIEGLGMGKSLLSLICDIYVHYFEEKLFSVYKFPHWFRYVDDTFVLVPSNTDFSSLLSLVISIDCCIHGIKQSPFTLEVENDKSLPFLDVLVSEDIDRF